MTTSFLSETLRMSSNGIACPQCGGTDWRVWRTTPSVNRVDRIRRCKGCGLQYRTSERVVARDRNQKKTA